MEEAKGKERSLELPGLQTRIDVLLETVQQSSPVRVQQLTLKHTHTQNWLLPALAGGGVVANPRKNKKKQDVDVSGGASNSLGGQALVAFQNVPEGSPRTRLKTGASAPFRQKS